MKTPEQIEELMRKFYEDKAEAVSESYQKILYESPIPLSDEEKREIARKKRLDEIEGRKIIVEENKKTKLKVKAEVKIEKPKPFTFSKKRNLTPEEEVEDREFWAAYRREKEKQKHERFR
jgi:hypothetical protein